MIKIDYKSNIRLSNGIKNPVTEVKKKNQWNIKRREFVKGMGALGVAAAVAPLTSCDYISNNPIDDVDKIGDAVVPDENFIYSGNNAEEAEVAGDPVVADEPEVADDPVVADEPEAVDEAKTETVYRFQTRKARTCKACKNHSRYKVFMTHDAADQNRAHPGCNCRIVEQMVTKTYLGTLTPHATSGVVELRSAFGYG